MHLSGGRDDDIRIDLTKDEAELLRSLLGEMRTLLEADIPNDAIKARLFPRAFEDPDDEKAFEELTRGELEDTKLAAVRAVEDQLGRGGSVEISLDEDGVGTWLRLLTDLRLAIGTRLEVTEETMASEIDPADPNGPALTVLHWLGWMSEAILERAD
jgi:hypothetical protein